jgi:hypothetical protein
MAYGFRFSHRLSGGAPTIQSAFFTSTETITKGDMVSVATGKVAPSVTNDATLGGVALETVAGTASTSSLRFISDEDAVYAVDDANARLNGASLNITGTTGAFTVTTSTNADVQVVGDSSATEPTLVKITEGEHFRN